MDFGICPLFRGSIVWKLLSNIILGYNVMNIRYVKDYTMLFHEVLFCLILSDFTWSKNALMYIPHHTMSLWFHSIILNQFFFRCEATRTCVLPFAAEWMFSVRTRPETFDWNVSSVQVFLPILHCRHGGTVLAGYRAIYHNADTRLYNHGV